MSKSGPKSLEGPALGFFFEDSEKTGKRKWRSKIDESLSKIISTV